jgi:hypothetical protein
VRYERLLHILYAARELFTDDVKKSLGRRKHDEIRKAFWRRIDDELKMTKEVRDV